MTSEYPRGLRHQHESSHSFQLIFKKRKERLVIPSLTIAQTCRVLSDIFASCRRHPTINSSAKSDETVETTSNKENIACGARSSVKLPPVVKSTPQIAKKSRQFHFDAVLSEAAYPVVQNYMQRAPSCQTLPKDSRITEMYHIARHFYDPYLPSYSYGKYWPVKIRHYCNGKLKWIYLHKNDLRVRSFRPGKEPNECSIDL